VTAPVTSPALAAIPTPFLLVDVAALRRNVARAVALADGVSLRPHFKAHKCTRVLAEQVAGGGCRGVTCATAAEARVLAEAGFGTILVANEVVHPAALALLAAAARRVEVTACADAPVHVERLGAVAAEHGVELGVLLDVDVGQHRCGLPPGSPELIPLAARIARTPGLRLEGLMGYDGHAQHRPTPSDRAAAAQDTAAILAAERDRLAGAGYPSPVVSGGGTGTLQGSVAAGVLTEVQAGSYALMDVEYGAVAAPFERAVSCVATVISRHGGRAVADAGLKALSCEHGLPVAEDAGVQVVGMADEHATLAVSGAGGPAVGDAIALVPHHLDPTVNLHAALHARHPDGSIERWDVDGG
jgi:D-serine deaminase-like pyridoxal phosphate-dependent protein